MKPRKKHSSRILRALCAEVHADDGVDPRDLARGQSHKKSDRKARQLCGQVAELLSHVLAGQSGDDVLQSLQIVAVAPAPDGSRLMVTVGPLPSERIDPALVLERLQHASARLRYEAATAITRKRAPQLVFRIALDADSALR